MIALELANPSPRSKANPALGLVLSIWNRHRQGILAVYIYLAFLCVAVRFSHDLLANADYFFTISLVDAPLLFAFVYLVGTFTGAGADIVSGKSGFPTHFNLLPITSRTIVNVLAIFSVSVLVSTWAIVDSFVLAPIGQSIALAATLPTIVAGLLLLQMLVWTPLGVPFVRIPLALCIVGVTIASMSYEAQNSVPVPLVVGAPVIVFVVGLLCSYQSVAMTRCGDKLPWDTQLDDQVVEPVTTAAASGFGSPFKALLWMEWRTHGRVLPVVVGSICLLSLAAFFEKGAYPLDPIARSMDGPGMIRGPLWLMIGQGIPFVVLWMAACVSGSGSKSEEKNKEAIINPFAAVRPSSVGTLISAKFGAAALATLWAWAAVTPFIVLWMCIPANDLGATAPAVTLMAKYASSNIWFCMAVGLLVFMLLTWKVQVDNLFFQHTEREWLKYVYWIVLPLIYAAPVEIIVLAWADPDFFSGFAAIAPLVIYIIAGLKCITAAIVSLSLVRRHILTASSAIQTTVLWLIVVAVLSALMTLAVPAGQQSALLVASVTVLLVPAVRIGLAPLELHNSRHR